MKRNQRGISLVALVIAITIMAVLVAVGVVLVLNKQDTKTEKEDNTKFLKDMKNVTYVELHYDAKIKGLDNELAEILQDLDSDSIDKKSSSKYKGETGEQAYSFVFYDEDDEELYRLQFTKSREDISIWKQEDSSKVKSYNIDDKEVLEYIVDEVNDFEEEYFYNDLEEIDLTYREEITDEDIIYFLKENDISSSYDAYITYDRDIGNYGPEGNKRYIYKRKNGSYYYIEISPLSYTLDGEYWGYKYKANEVFYRIDIQDCNFNENAEYMDERISDVYGDVSNYIISGSKNNLKLMQVTP